MLTVGVDVGGTFTDVFVRDFEGKAWVAHKVPSTPPHYIDGFLRGVEEAVARFPGGTLESLGRVVHGTTVATNAILTQSGAKIGFLMTEGCKDVLYIGVGWRPRMYDLDMDPIEPLFLAPRKQSIGIHERMDARGNVLVPLDEDHVRSAAKLLVEKHGVEVFVVCYMHSYANPAHEQRTGAILNEIYPQIPVTLSSAILPRRREYDRLVVSGFDGYVKPAVTDYINGVVARLESAGVKAPLHVMQSNGGVGGVGTIVTRPVRTVLSGLAAGVIGAAHVGAEAGHPNCISLDMGGTSADMAMIRNGKPVIASDGSFEDYPMHLPMVNVRTIGAGGSSIAYVDEGGGLRVGPRSAGSNPGPACYNRGGKEPTVTDASFILGYLNPATFAGGIDLDISKSYEAVENYIAKPLGLDVMSAALGIHAIVNSNMAQTLRLVSIKRGYDPREFTFIPFGGAGALHASRLAEDVGMRTVLVPVAPGVLSAMGLMLAPVQHDALISYETTAAEARVEDFRALFDNLDAECGALMIRDNVRPEQIIKDYYAQMRYVGQSHELEVPIAQPLNAESIKAAALAFHEVHKRAYSHADRNAAVEFVTLRAVHRKDPDDISLLEPKLAAPGTVPEPAYRDAYFTKETGYQSVPVYKRSDLPAGYSFKGPAIIEQADTTTVVYPGHNATIDDFGNIIITTK